MEHATRGAAAFTQPASEATAEMPPIGKPALADTRFHALVRRRRTFAWSLTALMLIIYFGYILTLAFSPATLGQAMVDGLPMSWGIPIGFGMFAVTFVLVAVYVYRTNTVYDAIISEIKQGAAK